MPRSWNRRDRFQGSNGQEAENDKGFYDFIESDENGLSLLEFGGVRFYAMAHPGGMGAANRKSEKGGGKSVIDDWAFFVGYFKVLLERTGSR